MMAANSVARDTRGADTTGHLGRLKSALAAAELLEHDWNIATDVWSITSFTELSRGVLEVER
jgi:pyruvate dehydrogenase complex dehydrogenase (E1) component